MTTTTLTYWSIEDNGGNEFPLQNYAYNIVTWGEDRQAPPSFRGSDITVPSRPGDIWLPKVPDSRAITLQMWVVGADEDGMIPVNASSRLTFERNWETLKSLFWRKGEQFKLVKRFRRFGDSNIIKATALVSFSNGLQPSMDGTQRARFNVQLKLTDPFFYGEEERIELSPELGPIFNEVIDGDYGTTDINIETEGTFSEFKLENKANNNILEFNRTFTSASKGEIDVPNFQATVNNAQANGYIEHSGGYFWFKMENGNNEISLTGTGSGKIIIKYRPAYY